MNTHQLRIAVEYRRRDVIDLAADEPAHRHVQLQVHHVELAAREERTVGRRDVLFGELRPRGQKAGHHGFARGFLLGLAHAYGRPDYRAQVFDVVHHPLVARGLEVVGRMLAVAAADQHENRIGVR